MTYVRGRQNLACTIFFPVRCSNNCTFCNTKHLYNNYKLTNEYKENIFKSIEIADNSWLISEFVITGGEPLASLDLLKEIVSKINNKPIYINTSLPNFSDIDECIDYINNEPKILGVNISRHIGINYDPSVCGWNKILEIKKYKRINCLIKPEYVFDEKELFDFINRYNDPYTLINFRADYRLITPDTLKNRDLVHEWLMKNFRFEYSNNCLVCNSEFFTNEENEQVICYHRGLEKSRVDTEKFSYINDVLIGLNGDMYSDWEMENENPDKQLVQWLIDNKYEDK